MKAKVLTILLGLLLLMVACGPPPPPSTTDEVEDTAVVETTEETNEPAEEAAEETAETEAEPETAEEVAEEIVAEDSGEIEFELIEEGDGATPESGDWVSVHFIAYLSDGTQFFSTYELGETLVFPYDVEAMMPGLDMAIGRMNVGSTAEAIIPPSLAFGAQGSGQVPPNETLTFELELVEILDIEIETIEEGEGDSPQTGDLVTVHYTGTLEDGTEFDSSYSRNEPFQFILGVGQVIPGWDIGLAQMRPGGKAILTIPPELAYGFQDRPSIPGGSTLIFEVELIEVGSTAEPPTADE